MPRGIPMPRMVPRWGRSRVTARVFRRAEGDGIFHGKLGDSGAPGKNRAVGNEGGQGTAAEFFPDVFLVFAQLCSAAAERSALIFL